LTTATITDPSLNNIVWATLTIPAKWGRSANVLVPRQPDSRNDRRGDYQSQREPILRPPIFLVAFARFISPMQAL